MPTWPVDVDLGEQRERDPVVHRAELTDLLRRAGLLLAELVAREPSHGEPALGELVVEPLQALVLRCQPALGCHIDDEYRRAGEIAEGGWISAQSLKSNVLHGHVGTPGVMLMGTFARSSATTRAKRITAYATRLCPALARVAGRSASYPSAAAAAMTRRRPA